MRRRIPNNDNGYFNRIVGVILDFGFIVPRKMTIGKELIRSIGLEKKASGEPSGSNQRNGFPEYK